MSGLEASLLLGSLHSVLLAFLLSRRERNRSANRYLAALLVAMSLLLFDGFLRARGVLAEHPHLIGLVAWVPFVIGPLVFLYVREMTAPDPGRVPSPWKHFVVTAAYVVLLIVTFFPRSTTYKLNVARDAGAWFITAIQVGLLVYGIAYAIAALVLLRRHRGHVQQIYSNLRGVDLRWLLVLAVLNTLVWVGALTSFVIRMTGVAEASAGAAIVPIGSTITVFVIGYFQLGQGEIYAGQPALDTPSLAKPAAAEPLGPARTEPDAIEVPRSTEPTREEPAPIEVPESIDPLHATALPAEAPQPATPIAPAVEAKPAPAYQRARLAEEDAAAVEVRIRAAMTDKKLYQRAGLTLGELADEVAATPHEVSQVLSTRLQRNFYNFVNEHRIEHVKAALRQTDRAVLDLAFEAGFQSKSTFNSAFRKATGTTPREFRERATA